MLKQRLHNKILEGFLRNDYRFIHHMPSSDIKFNDDILFTSICHRNTRFNYYLTKDNKWWMKSIKRF